MIDSPLGRWARWCHRRRWRVIAAWAIALVFVGLLATTAGGEPSDDFGIPGAESQEAYDLLRERFPEMAGDNAMVVFSAEESVTAGPARDTVESVTQEVRRLDHVLSVDGPYDSPGQVTPVERIAF